MPFVSIETWAGGLCNEYESTLAGISASIAVLVTVRIVSSLIV